MADNPWGLTPRQADVIDALIETGCNKGAARRLGVELCTVEAHMRQVQRRMGLNRVLAAVWWDRWKREDVIY